MVKNKSDSANRSIYLEQVKKELLERKRELEEILTTLSKEKFSENEGVQDIADQALSSTMEALKTSYQQTEHKEYDLILRALKAIDNGTYGVCIDCGQPISEKRLKLFPNATRCLACQEAIESQSFDL